MKHAELLEWGKKEDAARRRDLKGILSQEELETVQDAVKRRRKAAGLSAGRAAEAVILAQRAAAYEARE